MPDPTHRHVKLTSDERRLRSMLAAAVKSGDSETERKLRVEYNLAVARRRSAEYAARAEELESELARL